jgi:transcription elongation factor GreA
LARAESNKVASFFLSKQEFAMSDQVPMTREGYNRIKAEIERLENEEMPRIAEKIAEARAEGDLKENAEYHAQRENQGGYSQGRQGTCCRVRGAD